MKSDLGISIEDLYRLSVEQYHAIADACILDEDDPVELLEGWLVCKYGPFEAPWSRILPPCDASLTEEDGLSLAWIWRFQVDEYHAMIDAEVLAEGDPIELLGGWLVRKLTQTPAHAVGSGLIRDALAHRIARPWHVRAQGPITIPEGEPEPDVAVVHGDHRDYLLGHPGPDEVALVVEVADTSLARDRGIKRQMYAHAGIPTYWIVNLVEHCIEVYTDPSAAGAEPAYRQRHDYGPLDTIPFVLDGAVVGGLSVSELLP